MKQITNITNDAKQVFDILLDDGTVINLSLNYLPAIQRWSYSLSHPEITINGKILCSLPNVLREYRKTLSFGMMCYAIDGVDPIYIDDFSNGRLLLYILTSVEVEAIESNLRSLK